LLEPEAWRLKPVYLRIFVRSKPEPLSPGTAITARAGAPAGFPELNFLAAPDFGSPISANPIPVRLAEV